jgi:hypothetical protein
MENANLLDFSNVNFFLFYSKDTVFPYVIPINSVDCLFGMAAHPHWVNFGVRWPALGHFDGGDPQGPDVGFHVVAHLLDQLRGHPVDEREKRN